MAFQQVPTSRSSNRQIPALWPPSFASSNAALWFGVDGVADSESSRTRTISQSSSTTSGVFSRDNSTSPASPTFRPRPIVSPLSQDGGADAGPSAWPSGVDSGFSAGLGVNFDLLCDELEEMDVRAEPAFDKLNAFINYLDASTARVVMVDKTMWLDNLKLIRHRYQMLMEKDVALCVFCRNNNEPRSMYLNHKVRDKEGKVTCPVLRRYQCPLCHVSGDHAHTIKYCPLATSVTAASCFRTARNATGRRRPL